MWISRKIATVRNNNINTEKKKGFNKAISFIDGINKPFNGKQNTTAKLETVTFVVSGAPNIGKSTLIRFALQNLTPKNDNTKQYIQCHHTEIEFTKVNCPVDVIELNKLPFTDLTNNVLPIIHGSLVCYDMTNKDSLDCIPDLLSFYLSRNIPTYLIGLKGDLISVVDLTLIQQMVDLYSLYHVQVDAFSESGVEKMKNIFKSLLKEHYPNLSDPLDDNSRGFVYAPTSKEELTIEQFSTTSVEETDPDIKSSNKRDTNSSLSSQFNYNSRRDSKDSCDSFGIGLTIEIIIDRLLSTENNKADKNIIPIFLTFYRRFMKPYDFCKILTDRFMKDGISVDSPPSDLQKRIYVIFSIWLTHYWNDFNSPHIRKHITLFIDDISKHEHYTSMCDSLAPLVIREPSMNDPDQHWGLSDDNSEESEENNTWPIKNLKSEKKDSAYSSGIFSLYTPQSPLASPVRNEFFLMKRASTQADLSPIRRMIKHSESHPNLKSRTPAMDFPRRTEFAGGLINIDHIRKPQQKMPTSCWSLGQQLLASSSLMSSFRHHPSDKDQSSYNYKMIMKSTDREIADQLTWVEAELFSTIQPREFLRNLWHTANQKESQLNNNTVLASIAHFNFISAWIVTMIITQPRLTKRVVLLQRFMSVAVELRNLNNYNSLMAVLAGINSAPVLRLKQTRRVIETKKIYKRFQSLERLMSSDRSYSSYRLALKTSGSPGIPYLGIHNQDLVSLVEANKDFRADGTVHWEKFRLMGETIMATMKFRYPTYHIEPNPTLLSFIADCYILSEDEQYKKSILIEPRLSSASNNNIIRNLWLRI